PLPGARADAHAVTSPFRRTISGTAGAELRRHGRRMGFRQGPRPEDKQAIVKEKRGRKDAQLRTSSDPVAETKVDCVFCLSASLCHLMASRASIRACRRYLPCVHQVASEPISMP